MSQVIWLDETPKGMVNPVQVNENLKLPGWAPTGWSINSYVEASPDWHRGIGADPVVIHNKWGHIVYQWPEGYIPSIGDISEVLSKLGGTR